MKGMSEKGVTLRRQQPVHKAASYETFHEPEINTGLNMHHAPVQHPLGRPS